MCSFPDAGQGGGTILSELAASLGFPPALRSGEAPPFLVSFIQAEGGPGLALEQHLHGSLAREGEVRALPIIR